MTKEQQITKILLDYQTELNGMIIENKQRELNDFAPAYGEEHFRNLMIWYQLAIKEIEK